MIQTMNTGENIERLRKSKKLSMVELALLVGVKPQYISQIESGKRSPSLKVLQKLAKALNTTTSELLEEVQESMPVHMKRLVEAASDLNPQQVDIVITLVREISGKYRDEPGE